MIYFQGRLTPHEQSLAEFLLHGQMNNLVQLGKSEEEAEISMTNESTGNPYIEQLVSTGRLTIVVIWRWEKDA